MSQKKGNIKGWDGVSVNLFALDLSMGSESSTAKRKMVCVFNFTTVTELILHYGFVKQSITLTAALCSSMGYLFNSGSNKIIVWDKLSF